MNELDIQPDEEQDDLRRDPLPSEVSRARSFLESMPTTSLALMAMARVTSVYFEEGQECGTQMSDALKRFAAQLADIEENLI